MNTWRVVRALWRIGNYWVRVAIAIVVSWPVLIVLAAFVGWPALTATVALLPLFGMVVVLMTIFDPLVLAALVPFGFGRMALTGLAGLIGLELAIGAYFAAVPVTNDRGLIPLQLLLVVGIIFLAISGFRRMAMLLGLALAIIAAISFMGGREKASERLERMVASAAAPAGGSTSQTFEVGPKDWVEKPIPPDSLWNTTTDAPVWIWVHSCGSEGCMYMLLPDGSVLKGDRAGDMKPAPPCRPGGPPCMDFGTATKVSFKVRDKDTLAKVTLGSPVRR